MDYDLLIAAAAALGTLGYIFRLLALLLGQVVKMLSTQLPPTTDIGNSDP